MTLIGKLKSFFNLDRPYEFDITDITALIYTICAIGGIMGANMTILWCIGATVATAFCWEAHKINLVVLNVALWVMNMWSLFQMIIWG